MVFYSDGRPWNIANLYLLQRMEMGLGEPQTVGSVATDLAAFLEFFDKNAIDWLDFNKPKLLRPTYRFLSHLRSRILIGELSATTANRRLSSVRGLYRWMMQEGFFSPTHSPWGERDLVISFDGHDGSDIRKKVITTDLKVSIPKSSDPYSGEIQDGGRLFPLTPKQQEELLKSLQALGNPEMLLIYGLSLCTGARIQTVLTFRLKHVWGSKTEEEVRIPIGPGTGIDTKYGKRMVLCMPNWFYTLLRTYAHSQRAKKRRAKAEGGDHENQFLFLSVRGAPLYHAKKDSVREQTANVHKQPKTGQGVRQFHVTRLVPYMREHFDSGFNCRFHDLRATYGMNLTDALLIEVELGRMTLDEVRNFVRTKMGHKDYATTDRYLGYRHRLKINRTASLALETRVRDLILGAIQESM
jgi:integrase